MSDFWTAVLAVAVLGAAAFVKAYDATWIRRGAAWGERTGIAWHQRRTRWHRDRTETSPDDSPEDQP